MNDYLQNRYAKMNEEIATLTAAKMDKTDRDAWVDYYVSRYEIIPLEFFPDNAEFELDEKKVKVYNQWYRMLPCEKEYHEVPGVTAIWKVPFMGEQELLKLKPSTHLIKRFNAVRVVKTNEEGIGYLVLDTEMPESSATAEGIKEFFAHEIDAYIQEAECLNHDIKSFNSNLRGNVEKAIDKRIASLDNIATFRQGLNLPLQRVADAPMAKPLPLKRKRKLVFSQPKPLESENASSISDADYKYINEIIENCCAMMEQAPGSYESFGEEQLRDHINSVLGTHFENVTGETFRKVGKTDIHIPVGEHAAFIAECKIWHGPKLFNDAISQLFSYTTWRDTKVSLVVFNKENKNIEGVFDAIGKILCERAIDVIHSKSERWDCKIQNPEDERIMHVAVHVFDLHV